MTAARAVAPGTFAAPGWYGKVSMLGDFAQRRLPAGFVQRIDGWLSGWLVQSRGRLGDRWLDAYLSAPLLRFAWGPGVVGPSGWFGVLMPSCDRTGRYFPLLVAEADPGPASGRIGSAHRAAWFDQVAAAATCTLDDDASLEAFEAALALAGGEPDLAFAAPDRPTSAASTERPAACRVEALASDEPAEGESCWWTQSVDGIDSRPTRRVGLPEAIDLTRLWLLGTPPGAAGG